MPAATVRIGEKEVVVEFESGRRPEDAAEEAGGILVDYHESRAEAEVALASSPTGKIDTWPA